MAIEVVRRCFSLCTLVLVSSFLLVPDVSAQNMPAFVGKWSDSPDKKTCEIPVGSSPDVATLYQISPKSIIFYEIECTAQDITGAFDRIAVNVDCFKGGGSRWFETLTLRALGPNRLQLASSNRRPPILNPDRAPVTLYRCPFEAVQLSTKTERVSQWSHNGSLMTLSETGDSVEIDYVAPRKGLSSNGVRPQTMLFFGSRKVLQVEGTAYIFDSKCGPVPYSVEGQFSGDQRALFLTGQSPRVNSVCETVRSVAEVLRFEQTP